MIYDVDDFIRSAERELGEYTAATQRFEGLIRSNTEKRAELQTRRNAARAQLADTLLSDLSVESVTALAQRLNLGGVLRAKRDQLERDSEIERRLAAIGTDPYFVERDLKRLKLERQLGEIEPIYNRAVVELDRMQRMEGLTGLIKRQYGTPNYPHRGLLRFVNAEYLRDWRHADQIVAALGVKDFPEVTQRYQERSEQSEVLGESVRRAKAEQAQIDALERENAALIAEREALPELTKARIGDELYKHYTIHPPTDEAVQRAITAVDGIEHQIRYLEETHNKIEADFAQLLERSGKLREETTRYASDRYRYRNKSFSQDQFDKRFGRAGRWNRVGDRYERVTETVYVFNDYDRGFGLSDVLWWDLMTDGRIDGNFIPEVAEYRSDHPDYSYAREASYGGDSFARDDS